MSPVVTYSQVFDHFRYLLIFLCSVRKILGDKTFYRPNVNGGNLFPTYFHSPMKIGC